jgi:hypothetical protein
MLVELVTIAAEAEHGSANDNTTEASPAVSEASRPALRLISRGGDVGPPAVAVAHGLNRISP